MGAVADAIRQLAPSRSAPTIRTGARVAKDLVAQRPRHRRRPRRTARRCSAPVVVTSLHPQTAFLDHVGRANLPTDFVRRHRALEDPLRRREDQPRARRAARLHRQPGHRTCRSTTPARSRWRRRMEYIERAFQDAREGRPALRAVLRRRDPHDVRQDPRARGHAHHVAVHPVGPVRLERRAAPRRARGVRRPGDRPLQRGRAELQGVDPAPPRHRPVRDGARVRPDRRQHLPRGALARAALPPAPGARLRRLPHPVPGLYKRSSATHAGGGVCGIPGMQAAKAAIADRRDSRSRRPDRIQADDPNDSALAPHHLSPRSAPRWPAPGRITQPTVSQCR